jgi:Domain of unknown function (DUF397)
VIEEFDRLRWHRSRHCGTGACLEYAPADDVVYVRDSKEAIGPVLVLPSAAWDRFIELARSGRITRPAA